MATKGPSTFAEARARLDEILADLEGDSGDVDQLAARVREASELIRFCRERLSAARQEVTEVVSSLAAETADTARAAAPGGPSGRGEPADAAADDGEPPPVPPPGDDDWDEGPITSDDLPF